MIDIIDKKDCVGCNACAQRCPKSCISFTPDKEGFLYPKVDLNLCIRCNLCERVCPVINQAEPSKPLECYAAKSSNKDVKLKSSSGGIFFTLAEHIIGGGGVVFGAKMSVDRTVRHSYADRIDALEELLGSKYVQSEIGESYIKAENYLKAGRDVLFSGTPCQTAGLRLFLRKEYPNLVTVDVACHSVPSPKIWKTYIDSFKDYSFNKINFRDKSNGWLGYGFSLSENGRTVFYQKSSENPYMQGFLKDLYTRPSCFDCPAKAGKSGSDITLADFWGIWDVMPDYDYSFGASAVIAHSNKGLSLLKQLPDVEWNIVSYHNIVRNNPALVKNAKAPKQRALFWERFETDGINCISPIVKSMQPSFFSRLGIYALRKLKLK